MIKPFPQKMRNAYIFILCVTLSAATSFATAEQLGTLATVSLAPQDWKAPGDGSVRVASDEQPQFETAALEGVFSQEAAQFSTSIRRIPLESGTYLVFEWRATGDPVNLRVTLSNGEGSAIRNYYLNKRPTIHGQWQQVWLDLGLDDDGAVQPKISVPEGRTVVQFSVDPNPVAKPSGEPRYGFELRNASVVRPAVTIEAERRTDSLAGSQDEVGQEYRLTLINHSEEPQNVRLHGDTSALEHFRLEFEADELSLPPKSRSEVVARIKMSVSEAQKLPPLYSESAPLFLEVESGTDASSISVPWVRGYWTESIRGAVPPASPPSPLHHAKPDPSAISNAQLSAAEIALDLDLSLPSLRHGNPNDYFHRDTNSQFRFHGQKLPNPHWSEGAKEYIDMETQSEVVQKAGSYAHHAFLAETARNLARVGWHTGDRRFSKKAAQVLSDYARIYPSLDYANSSSTGLGSRVSWGILQESWWFEHIIHAYDWLKASGVWSKEEEEAIRENLLLVGARDIARHRATTNQQAEYNRAIGLVGILAEDPVLAAEGFYGDYGMKAQWDLDFDADGWTAEQDLGYHRAALVPFIDLASSLKAIGVPALEPRLKQLVDASVLRSPNLVGPPLRTFYELFEDPIYERSLAAIEKRPLPVPPGGFPNSHFESSGLTVLRGGTGDYDLLSAVVNWGEPSHRSGKVLLDPLLGWRGFQLNQRVARIGYGYKQSGFSYSAAAGNALVFNGEKSALLPAITVATVEGQFPAGRWVSSGSRAPIPGVSWARSIFLCGDTIVIADQVQMPPDGKADAFFYLSARVGAPSGSRPDEGSWSSSGDGYNWFENVQLLDVPMPPIRYPLGKDAAAEGVFQLLAPDATEMRIMEGSVGWHPKSVSVASVRFQDTEQFWLAAVFQGHEKDGGDPARLIRIPVTSKTVKDTEGKALAFRLESEAGHFLLLTAEDAGTYQVEGKTLQGPLSIERL